MQIIAVPMPSSMREMNAIKFWKRPLMPRMVSPSVSTNTLREKKPKAINTACRVTPDIILSKDLPVLVVTEFMTPLLQGVNDGFAVGAAIDSEK